MTTTSRARRRVAAMVAVLAAAGACSPVREEARPPRDGDPLVIDTELIASLEAFDACDDLLSYLRTEGAELVGPYGFGGGVMAYGTDTVAGARASAGTAAGSTEDRAAAPAPAASSAESAAPDGFSTTNVQEAGVDEPDLVKTDGRRLVTIAGGQLRVVDLGGAEPRLASTLRLDESSYLSGELLLAGDRVLVLHQDARGGPAPMPMAARGDAGVAAPFVPPRPGTTVTVVDIADPAAPRVVETVHFDGDLVAARLVDGVARLVLRSGPPDLPFLFPSGSQASVDVATEANRRVVADSTLDDWLPGFTVGDGAEQRLTDCRAVRRPDVFSGVGMLSVVTLDAADPKPGPAATVIGAGDIVYASPTNLYVTSTAWAAAPPCPPNADCAAAPTATTTEIHRIDIADEVRTTYVASGRVAGRLLNSFSLSELDGDLRVATTDDSARQSAVVVLRRHDDTLQEVGRVDGLGPDERIYAVRFLGDRGYVVTFRQTDPLYVVDLADPTKPVVAGELKIPGYSAYLHPIGDHRLLGVGQEATEQGRVQGTQLSLFDVSDPANPVRLANAVLPSSRSQAEFDHHAFLWWDPTDLAMVPVESYVDGANAAVGFTVTADAVRELGRVPAPRGQMILRALVVGDRVLTLTDQGLQTSDLATLAPRSALAY